MLEVRVAGVGVAPGVQDRDHRLAGDVVGAEAGLLARASGDRTSGNRPCRTSDGCADRPGDLRARITSRHTPDALDRTRRRVPSAIVGHSGVVVSISSRSSITSAVSSILRAGDRRVPRERLARLHRLPATSDARPTRARGSRSRRPGGASVPRRGIRPRRSRRRRRRTSCARRRAGARRVEQAAEHGRRRARARVEIRRAAGGDDARERDDEAVALGAQRDHDDGLPRRGGRDGMAVAGAADRPSRRA